ncbi:hypothetical protein [uncultured Tateyamaria sp.]|uniref:hypothetical protein n=1 Tax=uncultured Tateyamaria sp. TaxID=455651 RepID=UPI0026204561|nr:hypothetical protein [uncultured Tateyamaria sp.]
MPTQLAYQKSQAAASKRILDGNPFRQWLGHLEGFVPDTNTETKGAAVSANTKFGTVATFGPCTHGHNSDDPNWAKKTSFVCAPFGGGTWTVFDIVVPTSISTQPLYYKGNRLGFENLSIPVGAAQSNKLGDLPSSALETGKRRGAALNEGFANTFYPVKEFNCPGCPYHDRINYSAIYARQSRDVIVGKAVEFRKVILDWTEHSWNSVGIQEMIDWTNAIDADLESMERLVS